MKAKLYVAIFGVLELWLGMRASDGVAHFAHLGGMAFGIVLILYWRGRFLSGPKRKP
jgi:membrane associated rhomboid family serine protease